MFPKIDGERLWASIQDLAKVGAYTDSVSGLVGVNRLALTDADRDGRRLVRGWFEAAGLEVRIDRIGNVYGRRRGRRPDLAPVLSGSHIDSVPTGGAFDGALGVLGALEVVRTLNAAGVETERDLEIAFFTDEEGARFGHDMLGSAVAVWAAGAGARLRASPMSGAARCGGSWSASATWVTWSPGG
jgi:N-carbamoyl-L-amino-acid hydrolase